MRNELVFVAMAAAAALTAAPKKPVYVGVRVCAGCHTGRKIGDQYSKWLHSKHSQAYAKLALPTGLEMAKLSGLRTPPQESTICLGCHATAWHAEDWEKDETFRIQDGVQCELCHGPGSEYATLEVMRDRQAAMKAGLRMPDQEFCVNCHVEKGSHVAVTNRPPIDVKQGWRELLHPLASNPAPGAVESAPALTGVKGPKYAGVAECGKCHRGPMLGNQWSRWKLSAHSGAWATLATPKALEIAAKKNIADPQRSAECLKCHSPGASAPRLESFTADEGVSCEACHGPGSDYMSDAVMRDRRSAKLAGLKTPDRETCLGCHQSKDFNVDAAMKKIAHPTKLPPVAEGERYKTPIRMALRPDGREVYVTCEASGSVVVVDPAARAKVAEIRVGGDPTGVTFAPNGRLAFVTNRLDDTVSVVDVASRKVVATLKTGNEPHGVLTDRDGKLLYVLNTSSNDIWVYDVASLKKTKTLSAGNGPWSLALSPDSRRILVTNMKSKFAPVRERFSSEVTVIGTDRAAVDDRVNISDANLMMGLAWHPRGEFALATLNRTKAAIPMTRLLQGWTINNGLAVMWRDGGVDEVLLDEPDMGFADASDVAFTPDGRYALVASAGTDRVAVVDVAKMIGVIRRLPEQERRTVLPNHLGYPTEFVVKHVATGRNPRAILVLPAAEQALIANSLDDSLGILDLGKMEMVGRIELGGSKTINRQRLGEQLFHNAFVTFHRQYSCNSCHPDGHVDGMTYDIEADGIGVAPVDNRTLRGILDTAPFKWEGTNPSLSRQCGARLAVFFTRLAPFTPEQLAAVDYYVTTIPRPPNRYRPLGAALSPAQRRGKAIFERTTTNDGRTISENNRCVSCHFPPYYTDRRRHDVGTKLSFDRTGDFDVPHLNNIYDSAPYLHNGMAATLEEIWTVYNPDDRHGVTNDMTKDQLNDLVEFLRTL
ncbi:MAG: beta-propeller fold lactonase family protein [Acidobacteria bacterium]|nr:beta-propeller fold lactonase family protein [Acidobacteriota bacterium]